MSCTYAVGAPRYILIVTQPYERDETHLCQKCHNGLNVCMSQRLCGRCPQCGDVGISQCITCTNYLCDSCTCDHCRGRMCICHKRCYDAAQQRDTPRPLARTISVHNLAANTNEIKQEDTLASAMNSMSIQSGTQSITPDMGVNAMEEYQGDDIYEYYDQRSDSP